MRRSYGWASTLRVVPGVYTEYAAGPMAWGER